MSSPSVEAKPPVTKQTPSSQLATKQPLPQQPSASAHANANANANSNGNGNTNGNGNAPASAQSATEPPLSTPGVTGGQGLSAALADAPGTGGGPGGGGQANGAGPGIKDRSNAIDRQLEDDSKKFKKECKILLLGEWCRRGRAK